MVGSVNSALGGKATLGLISKELVENISKTSLENKYYSINKGRY